MQIDPTASRGVQAVSAPYPTTGPSAPPTHLHGTLSAIADRLGTSLDALRGDLRGGQSLASVVAGKGISRADLMSFVESRVQARRQAQGLDPVDPTALDRIVGRAVDRSRGLAIAQLLPAPAPADDPTSGDDGTIDLLA